MKSSVLKTAVITMVAVILAVAGTFFLVVSSPAILEMAQGTRDKMENVVEGDFEKEEEEPPAVETVKPHVFYDTTPPSFIAAVSNGLLVIRGEDDLSGIASYIINGFEFTDINEGWFDIRLQQFDGGYKCFVIKAVDNVGNESEEFIVENPYYMDPNADSNNNPAEDLPISAVPTDPTTARGAVTEHMTVIMGDEDRNVPGGNTTTSTLMSTTVGAGPAIATTLATGSTPVYATPLNTTVPSSVTDSPTNNSETGTSSERGDASQNPGSTQSPSSTQPPSGQNNTPTAESGITQSETNRTTVSGNNSEKYREFYTIQTKNGKTFYMVIDKDGNSETAYFLTEISENDLLNATDDTKQNLPKNSVAQGQGIVESGLPSDDAGDGSIGSSDNAGTDSGSASPDSKPSLEETIEKDKSGNSNSYIFIGILAAGAIGAGYYFKVYKPKKQGGASSDSDEDYDDEYDKEETEEHEESDDDSDKEND